MSRLLKLHNLQDMSYSVIKQSKELRINPLIAFIEPCKQFCSFPTTEPYKKSYLLLIGFTKGNAIIIYFF